MRGVGREVGVTTHGIYSSTNRPLVLVLSRTLRDTLSRVYHIRQCTQNILPPRPNLECLGLPWLLHNSVDLII